MSIRLLAKIATAAEARGVRRLWPRRPSPWLLLAPVYRLYEHRLLHEVRTGQMPRHVGLILDGNRRHARRHGVDQPKDIYTTGADKLDELLAWCAELEIRAITLWVFSTDNLGRTAEEVSGILAAIEAKMARLAADPDIHRRQIHVRVVGRRGNFTKNPENLESAWGHEHT
jgi:short-chain Z-isoprenyl diphosphate synthase